MSEQRDATVEKDDVADAARCFPIARPVSEWCGYILDAEKRQIARASPEYAVQIVAALNARAVSEMGVQYERRTELDKRIKNGDDFAGDAYVRWVAPGAKP